LKLWERIVRMSGDPIIGFRMALAAELKSFGLLGHIAPRCATVLEAFEKTARYVAIASQAAKLSVKCDPRSMVIAVVLDVPSSIVQQNILLWGLTNYSLLPERLTGKRLRPKLITCAFAAPASADMQTIVGRCPHKFSARDNRIVFDRSVGDLTVPSADPELQSALARLIEQDLEALGPAQLPGRADGCPARHVEWNHANHCGLEYARRDVATHAPAPPSPIRHHLQCPAAEGAAGSGRRASGTGQLNAK
jgi:AraC-type transcriptional regulator